MPPGFQLLGPAATDPLGVWQVGPRMANGAVAFAAASIEASADPLVWEADLPAERGPWLAGQQRQLVLALIALDEAPARLRSALRGAVASGEAEPAAEAGLREGFERLRRAARLGPDDSAGEGWDPAVEECRTELDAVTCRLDLSSRVDTRCDGALLARTWVGWLGTAQTVCAPRSSSGLLDRHRQTVALALATQRGWVRWLARVCQLSSDVVALAGLTATPLLALPVAWRFIRDLLAERRGGEAG